MDFFCWKCPGVVWNWLDSKERGGWHKARWCCLCAWYRLCWRCCMDRRCCICKCWCWRFCPRGRACRSSRRVRRGANIWFWMILLPEFDDILSVPGSAHIVSQIFLVLFGPLWVRSCAAMRGLILNPLLTQEALLPLLRVRIAVNAGDPCQVFQFRGGMAGLLQPLIFSPGLQSSTVISCSNVVVIDNFVTGNAADQTIRPYLLPV